MRMKRLIAAGAACICASGAAPGVQTVSFNHGALGRLIQLQIQGAQQTLIQKFDYDPAGNRKMYQVSGATGQTAATVGSQKEWTPGFSKSCPPGSRQRVTCSVCCSPPEVVYPVEALRPESARRADRERAGCPERRGLSRCRYDSPSMTRS
jgi:hypothetical protein